VGEKIKDLDPNPHLPIDQMTGVQLPETLAMLTSHAIDSFGFDTHRFTQVLSRSETQNGRVHVVCAADDGTSLFLDYDPTDNELPVTFVLTPPEPAQ
jgi:hypothetical protein